MIRVLPKRRQYIPLLQGTLNRHEIGLYEAAAIQFFTKNTLEIHETGLSETAAISPLSQGTLKAD